MPADCLIAEGCDGTVDTLACAAGDATCSADGPAVKAGGPAVAGAGRAALPFTGIEDVVLPILIGVIGLMGGVVMYRWAFVRERLTRMRAGVHQYRNRELSENGFRAAAREIGYHDTEYWSRQRSA